MTILRLRTEVADERGRLGRLATAIAACRGNILGVDVHYLDGARVADEFLIEFTEGGSGEALANALRRAGGVTVEAERLDAHALVDPVARAIDIGAQLFAHPSIELGVEACVARLVRADDVRLVDDEGAPASALLRRASEGGAPVTGRERVLGGPEREDRAAPWALVLPDDDGCRRRWLVAERATPAFSSSEVARVAAVLRLAQAVAADARASGEVALARVGPPRPLQRRPAAFFRP